MSDTPTLTADVTGALRHRATGWAGPGVVSADDVIVAGRRLVRRRRALASVACAVLLVVTTAGSLAGVRWLRTDVQPDIAPFAADLTDATTLYPRGGAPLPLPVPNEAIVNGVVRLSAGGWVVRYSPSEDEEVADVVVLLSDQGKVITTFDGIVDARLSADGTHLAMIGVDGTPLRVVRLADLAERGALTDPARLKMDLILLRFEGDWVAARGGAAGNSDDAPAPVILWNWRTGEVRDAGTATAFDLAAGQVAHRVDRRPAHAATPVETCVDVVPLGDGPPTWLRGLCHPWLRLPSAAVHLSPDAQWLTTTAAVPGADGASVQPSPVLLRVADIKAGRWQPVATLLPGDEVEHWVDSARYVVRRHGGQLELCGVTGLCGPVTVPSELNSPVVVAPPGAGYL